jgi:arylsulfatase A-like enzyme
MQLLNSVYCDMIRHNDASFGELMNYLKSCGVYDSSLIFITSDHGEGFLEHGVMGHAHVVYEEQVKVPLVMKLPGNTHAGTAVKTPVSLVDVAPTVLEVTGAKVDDSIPFDGPSLIETLKGMHETRSVFCETQYEPNRVHSMSLRLGNWKWLRVTYPGYSPTDQAVRILSPLRRLAAAVRKWRYDGEFMFDLEVDPGEHHPSKTPDAYGAKSRMQKISDDLITTLNDRCASMTHASELENSQVLERLRALGYV